TAEEPRPHRAPLRGAGPAAPGAGDGLDWERAPRLPCTGAGAPSPLRFGAAGHGSGSDRPVRRLIGAPTAADGGTRLGGAESKRRRRPRLPAPPSRVMTLASQFRANVADPAPAPSGSRRITLGRAPSICQAGRFELDVHTAPPGPNSISRV